MLKLLYVYGFSLNVTLSKFAAADFLKIKGFWLSNLPVKIIIPCVIGNFFIVPEMRTGEQEMFDWRLAQALAEGMFQK